MSLEAALAAHTTALEANTAAILRHNEILEGLKAGKQTAVQAPKSDDKVDAKDAPAKDEEAPKRTRASSKDKAPKEKAPSVAEMKDAATKYLDVADEDEYNERRAVVRAITDHFKAAKFTEIETGDRLMASKLLEMAASGENFDKDDIEGMIAELTGTEKPEKPARSRRDDDL